MCVWFMCGGGDGSGAGLCGMCVLSLPCLLAVRVPPSHAQLAIGLIH